MSDNIEGLERPKPTDFSGSNQASVRKLDHHNNSGVASLIYGGPQTILADTTSDPGNEYYGFAAPGSDTVEGRADARWRIMKVTGSEVRWAYTTLDPAIPGTGPDFAGRPVMIWDDRLIHDYA